MKSDKKKYRLILYAIKECLSNLEHRIIVEQNRISKVANKRKELSNVSKKNKEGRKM